MSSKRRTIAMVALALGLGAMSIIGFAACSDAKAKPTPVPSATTAAAATGEEANVEAAVLAAYAAWNAKDVAKLLPHFTDKGLVATLASGEDGATADTVKATLPSMIGVPAVKSNGFKNTKVTGSTATTEVAELQDAVLGNIRYSFVKEAGAWKVDGQQYIDTPIPAGYSAVRVDLNEFAFGVDTSKIAAAKGGFAFEASNVGKQTHELALVGIPADAVVDDLLKTQAGLAFRGVLGPVEAGKSGNLVFTEPLKPGRYLLVCFLPDTSAGPDGSPHALKGMVKDFTIPATP